MSGPNNVDIGASQGVYALFAAYDYSAWQALAEFIDNSVSSFQGCPPHIRKRGVKVDITWDPDYATTGKLVIVDNAGGISTKDLNRAFKLATPPADMTRLNQFGVGMKVAACWFAKKWVVETCALGEAIQRTIRWNTNDIVEREMPALPIVSKKASADLHFTRITLTDLNHPPAHPLTIKKIKEFLPKQFRKFVERGWLRITWNGEDLQDMAPAPLTAPHHNRPNSKPITWQCDFVITLDNGMKVSGSARLFESWAKQHTALNYFWRERLIQGNIEPFNRPTELFGGGNSFRTGRLYVELDASEFKVTSDKKSIDFGRSRTSEGEILEQLKLVLTKATMPLLQQAENYRSGRTGNELIPVVEKTLIEIKTTAEQSAKAFLSRSKDDVDVVAKESVGVQIAEQIIRHEKVAFKISCRDAGAHEPWFSIEWDNSHKKPTHLVTVNLQHAFVKKYLTKATVRIFIGMAVSSVYGEFKARTTLNEKASLVGNFTDQFLRIIANKDEDISDADED